MRRAALGIHDKDVYIAAHTRIESNLLSVGRPTRRSRCGIEVGELNEATPVAPAHPDFIRSAAVRLEGNLSSVRRELRTTLHLRGRYDRIGRTGGDQ